MSKGKHRGRARLLKILDIAEGGACSVNHRGAPQTWLPEFAELLGRGYLERRRPRCAGVRHFRRTYVALTDEGLRFLEAHRSEVPAGPVSLGGFRWDRLAAQHPPRQRFRCRVCARGLGSHGFLMIRGLGPVHAACAPAAPGP